MLSSQQTGPTLPYSQFTLSQHSFSHSGVNGSRLCFSRGWFVKYLGSGGAGAVNHETFALAVKLVGGAAVGRASLSALLNNTETLLQTSGSVGWVTPRWAAEDRDRTEQASLLLEVLWLLGRLTRPQDQQIFPQPQCNLTVLQTE